LKKSLVSLVVVDYEKWKFDVEIYEGNHQSHLQSPPSYHRGHRLIDPFGGDEEIKETG